MSDPRARQRAAVGGIDLRQRRVFGSTGILSVVHPVALRAGDHRQRDDESETVKGAHPPPGTALPYSQKALTRDVDGIQPPGIRSLNPTSSTFERSGVAGEVATIGTRFGFGARRLEALLGVSVINRLRQCRLLKM